MLGTGVQFSRSKNRDDRFYSASRARKNQDSFLTPRSDAASRAKTRRDHPPSGKSKSVTPDSLTVSDPPPLCNLDRFLASVTPSVPAQYLSKMTVKDWRTCNVEFQSFFILDDLWSSYGEWSAYGAGVPLLLNDSDNVVQYYVPYLSGIQLYADLSSNAAKLRQCSEESDGEYSGECSSDRSSDSDLDRLGINTAFEDGFSSEESELGSSQSCLLFEYFARDQPYCREPLADKISELAHQFPGLKTLRSCDLLPSSWISVAWYPIYRIPNGPTLKDLDACFLTFHYLHTSVTGSEAMHSPNMTYPSDSESDSVPQTSLPVFGLASYKFKASHWTPNLGSQYQLANSLLQAADNWLNSIQVDHPDYSFFCHK